MTDTAAPIAHPTPDADGWMGYDGSGCPVSRETLVDVRFAGYDTVRTAPYIRHHEMWEIAAGEMNWTWRDRQYGHDRNDITHWRYAIGPMLDAIDHARECLATVGDTKMVQINRKHLETLLATIERGR